MPGVQYGHYGKAELRYEIEHAGLILGELQSVGYSMDPQIEAAGEGIGSLKNTYFKQIGAPKGSGKLSRNMLQRTDAGKVLLDIVAGSRVIIQEPIAIASSTYTVTMNTALVSLYEVRLNSSLTILRESVDYYVNYLTGTITFAVILPETATVRYLAANRKGQQFLINEGFEDPLGTTWTPFATATIARTNVPANVFVEGYSLAVTPIATGDGVQYSLPVYLQPGRQYRLGLRAKSATAETLAAFYNNGVSDVPMTPSSVTLTPTYALYEFTFVPTLSLIPNIKIKDTKATPAIFYLDQVRVIDDSLSLGSNPTISTNPMDAGWTTPIMFNIIERRIADGVVVGRLQKCTINKYSIKDGKAFVEDVDFEFLDYLGE